MIARGFKPVGWVATVGGAALGCYMLSLNVASERAELASLERKIVAAKQDIRTLGTELGTRGRMSQLEAWNADILALSAPNANQYLENEVMLARFDQRPRTIEERAAQVRLASAQITPRKKLAPVDFARIAAATAPAPAPLVRQASYVAPTQPSFGLPAKRQKAATRMPEPQLRTASYSEPRAGAAKKRKAKVPDGQPEQLVPWLAEAKPGSTRLAAALPPKQPMIDDSLLDSIEAASRAERKKGAAAGR